MKELKNRLASTLPLLAALAAAVLLCGAACRQSDKPGSTPAGTAAAAEAGRPIPRKDAFFGMHFDLHPNAQDTVLGVDVSEDNIAALLDRVKPDFVQYDCKGHPGYAGYPTKIGWPSPGIVKDSLAVWRKVTRERGIGLYIHYSGVWDSKAIEEHPDWARIDAQGKRDPNATSVFGPYVDKLLIPQLEEVTQAYALDGVWAVELVEPEPCRHDDEHWPVVDEGEFLAEELGVALRLSPEGCDGAEVGRRGDQRDPDREAGVGCLLQQRGDLRLLAGGDSGVLWEEQGLLGEDVAGRVAVGARCGGTGRGSEYGENGHEGCS